MSLKDFEEYRKTDLSKLLSLSGLDKELDGAILDYLLALTDFQNKADKMQAVMKRILTERETV